MDKECPADLVCEKQECVEEPPAPPAPPIATPPPAGAAPAATPSVVASAGARSFAVGSPAALEKRVKPQMEKRRSTDLMALGITLSALSIFPIAGMALSVFECSPSGCHNRDIVVGSLVAMAVLNGVGIPLIVIGAQHVPAARASVTPWAAPRGAALRLRFDL